LEKDQANSKNAKDVEAVEAAEKVAKQASSEISEMQTKLEKAQMSLMETKKHEQEVKAQMSLMETKLEKMGQEQSTLSKKVTQLTQEKQKESDEKARAQNALAEAEKENRALKEKIRRCEDDIWSKNQNDSALLEAAERETTKKARAEMSEKMSVMEQEARDWEQQVKQLQSKLSSAQQVNKAEKKKQQKKNAKGGLVTTKDGSHCGDDDFVSNNSLPIVVQKKSMIRTVFGKVMGKQTWHFEDGVFVAVCLLLIHVFLFPHTWQLPRQ